MEKPLKKRVLAHYVARQGREMTVDIRGQGQISLRACRKKRFSLGRLIIEPGIGSDGTSAYLSFEEIKRAVFVLREGDSKEIALVVTRYYSAFTENFERTVCPGPITKQKAVWNFSIEDEDTRRRLLALFFMCWKTKSFHRK